VHAWPLGISQGSDRHDTADHCLRLKVEPWWSWALVSLMAAFVEVLRILILFCSGGLAYI
jgi:hypothetical protein